MLPLWIRRHLPGFQAPPERWQHMMHSYHGDEVVVLDCETSRFDKKQGELLSVAAVIVKGKHIMLSKALDLTIRSAAVTDAQAVKVHFLRQEDRLHGVSTAEAIERLLDFIGNRPICGFYIEYDRAILNRYIQELYQFQLYNRFIDVSELYARLSRKKHPESELDLTFEGLAAGLDVPIIDRHTALGDVISTALMYVKLSEFGLKEIPHG